MGEAEREYTLQGVNRPLRGVGRRNAVLLASAPKPAKKTPPRKKSV